MISFGAVIVEERLSRSFQSVDMAPLCPIFDQGAYDAIGITRAEHEAYIGTCSFGFIQFQQWIQEQGGFDNRMTMVSDNPAFDWQWINWGFHTFAGQNPLGFSARRIGDIWAGHRGNIKDHTSWKKLRRTTHTHDPLDDVMGNAEALLEIMKRMKA